MIEISPIVAARYSPTVIASVLSTTMKSALLAFAGVCAAWAATGDLKAQAIFGDTKMRVTGDRLPVPGAASPAVTRKLVQVNGVDCEWGLPMDKVC